MYIATTYIGGAYTPGEILPDDFLEEKLAWLIEAGAVRKAESAPSMPDFEPEAMVEAEAPQEEPEADTNEIDEEENAPEIDVMDGIVQNAEPLKPAAKRKSAASSGSKRTPKGGKPK